MSITFDPYKISKMLQFQLSVSSQRKYNFYHQNALLNTFRMNSRNIIGRNPSMVIPLLANQDLTPMLIQKRKYPGGVGRKEHFSGKLNLCRAIMMSKIHDTNATFAGQIPILKGKNLCHPLKMKVC